MRSVICGYAQRFDVITEVNMKTAFSFNMTPCSLVDSWRHYERNARPKAGKGSSETAFPTRRQIQHDCSVELHLAVKM
jgi:hypothetical protein